MAYDALAESLRLIEGGPVAGTEPLTRRRRFLPVAVDLDGDIAATVFLRRCHGGAEWQTHVLRRTDDGWHLLGGGGWSADDLDTLTRVRTIAELGGPARADGAGSVRVSDRLGPRNGTRWIRHAELTTTAAVHSVTVAGRRTIRRPEHGHLVVVWQNSNAVQVELNGRDGSSLGELELR